MDVHIFSKRKNFHTNDILSKSKQTLKPTTLKIYLRSFCMKIPFTGKHIRAADQFLPKYSSNYMNLHLEVLL